MNNSLNFHEILFSGLRGVADYRWGRMDGRTNERTDIRITIYPCKFAGSIKKDYKLLETEISTQRVSYCDLINIIMYICFSHSHRCFFFLYFCIFVFFLQQWKYHIHIQKKRRTAFPGLRKDDIFRRNATTLFIICCLTFQFSLTKRSLNIPYMITGRKGYTKELVKKVERVRGGGRQNVLVG